MARAIFQKRMNTYVFSEVQSNGEKFIIPFDGNGIPMEYEEFQENLNNFNKFFESVSKEEYIEFYNNCSKIFYDEIENSSSQFKYEISERKETEKKNYINKFDLNITKPILSELEINNFFKKMISFPSSYINTENIKYPILIKIYDNNKLLKISKCTNNLVKTLERIKETCNFNKYSYTYIPENYIDQILEYSILFEDPTLTTVLSIKNHIVYNTVNAIQKRINLEKDYIIKKNTIHKIIKKNNIYCFEKDGKIFTNARLTIEKIGDYISGIKKQDLK